MKRLLFVLAILLAGCMQTGANGFHVFEHVRVGERLDLSVFPKDSGLVLVRAITNEKTYRVWSDGFVYITVKKDTVVSIWAN